MSRKDLINFAISEQLAASTSIASSNFCPTCKTPMKLDAETNECRCSTCGLMSESTTDTGVCTKSNSIRIVDSRGNTQSRYFAGDADYSDTQRQTIVDELRTKNERYSGDKLPAIIIEETANMYNSLQQLEIDGAKFVRRGKVKDEILAAIIYMKCLEQNIVKSKKDVAALMELPRNGFCRGDTNLRKLASRGYIKLVEKENVLDMFVDEYMKATKLSEDARCAQYRAFLIDLVKTADDKKISQGSQVPSKVVGAIWILLNAARHPLSKNVSQFESMCNNCKKNTFNKFCIEVMKRRDIFAAAFSANSIPIPKVEF